MTTTLQELDEVLEINTQVIEAQRINEAGAAHFFQQKFDYKASAFLRRHAPAIRAAWELKARVDAGDVVMPKGLLLDVEDQLIDLFNEKASKGAMYKKRERISDADILQRVRLLRAAPPAQGEQDGS